MNNSQAFKAAHSMTRNIIKHGDNYAVTFGQCLKLVIEQNKAQGVAVVQSERKARMSIRAAIQAIVSTIPEAIYQVAMASFAVGIMAFFAMLCLSVAIISGLPLVSVAGGFFAVVAMLFGMWIVSYAIENIHHEYASNAR